MSDAFVFVIRNGARLITRLPPSVTPNRRLTMTDPITSVWPVAITVLGTANPVNNPPCAKIVPDMVAIRKAARTVNLNFILLPQIVKNIDSQTEHTNAHGEESRNSGQVRGACSARILSHHTVTIQY